MPLLWSGETIRDTYEVERLLGEGAFAEVYRVKHRFLGRQAMKVFKAPGATIEDIVSDLKEALVLSALRHRNIIEVLDANVLTKPFGDFGYFTMTYVSGGSLEQYWKSFGASLMPVEQAVEIIRQTCRAVAVAHSAKPPIVHRDIKPANILIGFDASGLHVRLSDFGLAKSVNPLTLLATSRGTLPFKPPEALDNIDSCPADVWGLGATLHLLLTDRLPYPCLSERDADNPGRFKRPIRLPSDYNINIDPGLEGILLRCLAFNPVDRYPNAIALLADLELWEPGHADTRQGADLPKTSKDALPGYTGRDLHGEALAALDAAFKMARDPLSLSAAADLLEEAMGKDPGLRERYGIQLDQWRKGIMHCQVTTLTQGRGTRRRSP
ncbi:MAG: serine/threonine protein kinase [Sphingobacteriia bacterium]|nr:serine/threonine protein kinase [Sphingobacteriia bacterium]NCC41307.1 serine/threonine protein kinase [Gammaproteobacteria bacterium]